MLAESQGSLQEFHAGEWMKRGGIVCRGRRRDGGGGAAVRCGKRSMGCSMWRGGQHWAWPRCTGQLTTRTIPFIHFSPCGLPAVCGWAGSAGPSPASLVSCPWSCRGDPSAHKVGGQRVCPLHPVLCARPGAGLEWRGAWVAQLECLWTVGSQRLCP